MKGLVPEELKRAFLQKVVDSSTFGRSQQLRRLLNWLGERAIEGVTPSEYDVGISPLQRPTSFDPQTDSLVRKEMTRLRAKLQAYYAAEGRGDNVRLHSADAYRLSFQWSMPVRETPGKDTICVMILPLRGSGVPFESMELFYDSFSLRVCEAGEIQLIAPTTARFYAGRSGDIRTFAVETGADFVIEGTIRIKGDLIAATLWAVDGRTGRSRRPCSLASPNLEDLATRAAECLFQCLTGDEHDSLVPQSG
jgi:hypothetical protein